MTSHFRMAAAALVLAAALIGCGGDADEASGPTTAGAAVDQTVEVRMVDVAFEPEEIAIRAGTTVRFVFTNDGKLPHEAAFGDEATQRALADGKAKRDGPRLGPNQSEDYVRTFTSPGTLIIGCHVPGHYEAGMKVRVSVA